MTGNKAEKTYHPHGAEPVCVILEVRPREIDRVNESRRQRGADELEKGFNSPEVWFRIGYRMASS